MSALHAPIRIIAYCNYYAILRIIHSYYVFSSFLTLSQSSVCPRWFTIQKSNFASESDDRSEDMDSFPPIPVIPHGSMAVWLKGDDSGSTTVSRSNPVASFTNDVHAVPLNEDKTAASPQVSDPSFFELLENVSPHVQSVLLNKCTVLELSSLAVASSSLRKGALATMAKRSLNIRIGSLKFRRQNVGTITTAAMFFDILFGDQKPRLRATTVMFIDDISDPTRSLSVEFCNCQTEEYTCNHWTKIQKLILFCGHASVKRIDVETERILDAVTSPNRFAMRSAHTSSGSPTEEFHVDEFTSDSCEGAKQLSFIFPRSLEIKIGCDYKGDDVCTKLHAVFHSRGMLTAESIVIKFSIDSGYFKLIDDELMLKLNADSIVFSARVVVSFWNSYVPLQFNWTPKGVSHFIEQWMCGSRAIKKVTSGANLHYKMVLDFCGELETALVNLDPAPQVVTSRKFDDDLIGRLQTVDGEMIYQDVLEFNRFDAAVIRVTAPDGREVTIALTGERDIEDFSYVEFAFIDIFPSN